jgi:cell wall-associated NlpC family hydrolase
MRRLLAIALVLIGSLCTLAGVTAAQAHATTLTPGARMLNWAKVNATGHWYAWGGIGLATYDCSGLVYRSAHQIGVTSMPRTTYQMLASRVLVRTYHPVAGDLAFYGRGHVEIVDRGHDVTFGAARTGTRVGDHPWNAWWRPSMYFRVV